MFKGYIQAKSRGQHRYESVYLWFEDGYGLLHKLRDRTNPYIAERHFRNLMDHIDTIAADYRIGMFDEKALNKFSQKIFSKIQSIYDERIYAKRKLSIHDVEHLNR